MIRKRQLKDMWTILLTIIGCLVIAKFSKLYAVYKIIAADSNIFKLK